SDVLAEKLLWRELRAGKLGIKFRRQHPIGPYFADFACCEKMIVIELDGDTHVGELPEAKDEKRTKCLEAAGWRILRFWNSEVHDDVMSVVDTIHLVCQGRSESPLALTLSPRSKQRGERG